MTKGNMFRTQIRIYSHTKTRNSMIESIHSFKKLNRNLKSKELVFHLYP